MGCSESRERPQSLHINATYKPKDQSSPSKILRPASPVKNVLANHKRFSTKRESLKKEEVDDLKQSDVLGVKFSYFEQFITENGGRAAFEGKTTAEINATVLVSFGTKNKVSICQQLRHKNSTYVGKPTWFISHAWSYKFLDVVEAVGETLRHKIGEEKYRNVVVWFDQFTLLHPAPPSLPYEQLHNTFMDSTKQIGQMILVFDKWDNPTHLTRAWCVFEAYACLATESVLEVAMTQDENDRFLTAIRHDYTTFYSMLTQINTSKSIARYDEDRDKIHRAIRDKIDGGFTALDRSIFSELEKWMIRLLRGQIQESKENSVERADWQMTLAIVLETTHSSTSLDESESLKLASLSTRRRILGNEHPLTVASIGNLAGLYKLQGKYDQAEPLYVDCLSIERRILGDEHPSTLVSINNLAELYRSQGKYDKAEPLYVDCLSVRRRILGNEHPSTLISINNLAGLYKSQEKYEQAEPLYLDCLAIGRRVLGHQHPDLLVSMNDLAGLYKSQGKFDKAEPLYIDCLTTKRLVLGEEHPDTLVTISNLAGLYRSQNKYSEAESLYVDCVVASRRVLGDEHPDTLMTVWNLAAMYQNQKKYSLAEESYAACVAGFRRVLGDTHPHTLQCARMYQQVLKARRGSINQSVVNK